MSITLVGQAGVAGTTEASPHLLSYTSTTGNTLILTGLIFSSPNRTAFGLTSVTDNAVGNTWHFSTSNATNPPAQWELDGGGTGSYLTWVAWALNANAITAVTYAWNSGLSDFQRVVISEWTGINAADVGNAGSAVSGAPAAAFPLNLATSGDLVVGSNNSSSTQTPPAGWTEFTGSGSVAAVAYGLPEGPGSYTPTWTLTPAGDYAGSVMSFHPPIPPPKPQRGVPLSDEARGFKRWLLLGT